MKTRSLVQQVSSEIGKVSAVWMTLAGGGSYFRSVLTEFDKLIDLCLELSSIALLTFLLQDQYD